MNGYLRFGWVDINRFQHTAQGSGYKESQKYPFGYVAARQVDKAIKDGNDGIVYQNIKDPYLADNYGVFNSNQIKSATDNNGDFSLTDDSIQAAYGREIYNHDLKPQEINAIQKHIETLSKETDTSNGLWHIVSYARGANKGKTFAYKFNTSLYQYEQNRKDKRDGFEILSKIDLSGYPDIEINEIKKRIENGIIRNQESFNKWSESHIEEQRRYSSDHIDAEDRASNLDNVGLDKQTLQGESRRGQSAQDSPENRGTGQVRTGFDGTNGPRYTDEIEKFQTPQGELYGFVDKDGKMYLDETVISPEHPIHEYTHLWDRAVRKKNPELWKRGVELMKQIPLWNEILNDANYGKVWQSKGLPQSEIDNFIASEVHARLTGKNGEKLLDQIAKEQGHSGIIGKLKQWILDVWKELRATFGTWSKEDLDKLTLDDFNHMTVRDFAEGNLGNNPFDIPLIKNQSSEIHYKTIDGQTKKMKVNAPFLL